MILFYPPSDPKDATIDLSLTAVPFLDMENVSHVFFKGITWDLGSADAIRITGGDNCILAGCIVKRFAGNGIEIDGGHHMGLLSCDISSMGRGGVILSGGNRKTLEPGRAIRRKLRHSRVVENRPHLHSGHCSFRGG